MSCGLDSLKWGYIGDYNRGTIQGLLGGILGVL